MDVNPYQSPRASEPVSEGDLGSSASILQLLTEIRDAQQELLRIQRDALTRQQRYRPLALLFMVPALLLPLYFLYAARPVRPTPVPTFLVPPRTMPQPVPTASLLRREGAEEPR